MMFLSKYHFELTAYIAQNEEFKEFWNILPEEFDLSNEMTLLVSQYDSLMEEETVSRNSTRFREEFVLHLLIIQQAALRKSRKKFRICK